MISFTEYAERRVERGSEREGRRLRRGKGKKEGRGNMRKLFMVCTSLPRCMRVPPWALSTSIILSAAIFYSKRLNGMHGGIVAGPAGYTLLKK